MDLRLEILEVLRNIRRCCEAHEKIFCEEKNLDEKKQLCYCVGVLLDNLEYLNNRMKEQDPEWEVSEKRKWF